MVSELIPCCQDFRLNLSTQREKQRGECRWLFNIVELGAGTSFLVDYLLKTRAGENLLSLMTSIVPLMSPEANVIAISTLFDLAGVKPDHTPGVDQLHKLRNAVGPFSRSVGFQERVLQYHALFERIVDGDSESAKRGPYRAMPDEHNLSRITLSCHKIATAGNTTVLVYKGFGGSGWVAAYASCILGFPVCAINGSGVQFPVNDHYGQAKVILDLAALSSVCEVYVEGHLSDFFRINPLLGPSRCGWSINCLELNFLTHNLPGFSDHASVNLLSELVAFFTLKRLAFQFRYVDRTPQRAGFRPYILDSLPQIQDRSMENLALLGFNWQKTVNFRLDEELNCQASFSDPNLAEAFKDQWRFSWKVGQTYSISKDAFVPTLKLKILENGNRVSDNSIAQVFRFLDTAAWLASTLSFTDWNTGLRTVAARHFYTLKSISDEGLQWDGCQYIIEACNDVDKDVSVRRLQTLDCDWLALNFDGVIVLRTLAVSPSIHQAQGKIYSLLAGHITFEGQQREGVSEEPKNAFIKMPISCGKRYLWQVAPVFAESVPP